MVDHDISPLFSKIYFKRRKWMDQGHEMSYDKVQMPKTEMDPSDLGQYIDKVATLNIPSLRHPKQAESVPKDLHTILSSPIACTLPLIEFMRLQVELWKA